MRVCEEPLCLPLGAGRGKDMANITGHRGKDMSAILQEEGKENGRPKRTNAGQRRKKRRRLNDLDSDSTMDEEESEEEFRLSDRYDRQPFRNLPSDFRSPHEGMSRLLLLFQASPCFLF